VRYKIAPLVAPAKRPVRVSIPKEGLAMTRQSKDEIARGSDPPASEVLKVARKASGTVEIDVRAGYERSVREATENAMRCYRDASKARAAGDEFEAYGLVEIAEQSLDVARDVLGRLEGLA